VNSVGPENPPCSECGGERVRAWASTYLTDEQWGSMGRPLSKTYALVCTDCGHTTLYADHPEKLLPKNR
jgi:ribosomal protein S27AE